MLKNLKSLLGFITLISVISIYTNSGLDANKDNLLTVVLMVKNEESVIVNTVKPLVDAGINSFYIFDTGSTDKTIENVEQFFNSAKITNYFIGQEDFIDFSASRNRALRLAEEKFPETIFMIMPDAEWYINNCKSLIEFCKTQITSSTRSYFVRLLCQDGIDLYIPRLIRAHKKVQFKGPVHEVIDDTTVFKIPENIFFLVNPTRAGEEKSKKRWSKDAELLLKKHVEDPFDGRSLYYLGQTYLCLAQYNLACKYLERRTKLKSWDEEDYMAHYKLAMATQLENRLDINGWPLAHDRYLKAFELRPTRAEPLIRIAEHYFLQGNNQVAFLYSHRACRIEYPKNDILFVEKALYDFVRYYIVAITALEVGEYKIGEAATKIALEYSPQNAELQKKLKLYTAYNS